VQRVAVFLALIVLALIVAVVANGAVMLGPEQPARSAGPLGVPPAGAFRLTLASDGETAMVVWMSYNHEVTQVAGRRVTADGNPIGDAPILFSAVGNYYDAAIAWTGSRYILAWWTDDAIEARTVESDGALGPVNTIAKEPGPRGVLSMSCDSGRCILAWSRPDYVRDANFVSAAMIGNDALLVSDPIHVSDDLMGSEITTSAANGAFLVVENSTNTFHDAPQLLSAVILDRTGTIVHRIQVPPDGTQTGNLSATHTADGFIVAFDGFAGSNLLRIGFDGSAGSIQPIKNASWLRLADGMWNGYLVGTDYDSRTFLLDLNGNVIRSGSGADAIVLVGNDAALSVSGLSVQRINADLTFSNPKPLTLAPIDQYLPAIAAASQNEAMLMWAEPDHVLVTRLQDGVPQGDAVNLTHSYPGRTISQPPLSIASSGKSYLAVWRDDDGLFGQLFTASGSRTLPLPGHTSLAVGWDGDSYVVAYTTGAFDAYHGTVPHPEITRIDDAGNVLSTGDAGGRSGSEMSIQCGLQACINTSSDEVAFVTKYASVPLGTAPRQTDREVPTVGAAPAGLGFIVAENTPSGLQWFHVDLNGTKSAAHDPLPSDPRGGVAAMRLGSEVLIAWTSPAPRHLRGIVVDEEGTVTEGPFAMTSSTDEESLPAFANGRLAYVRSTDRYGVPRIGRVMTRSISLISRHRAATH